MTYKAGFKAALAAAALTAGMTAQASAQELSEKAVRAYMDYAWSLIPNQFTKPDGTVVKFDKSKKDEIMIPVDVAREVIKVGRFSAHAQICDLKDEQAANHTSMMNREVRKKTWTPQQLIYINQLHLSTVMLLTGKIKLVEKADGKDGKDVVVAEGKTQSATCSDADRQKVKDVILAYVTSGPGVVKGEPPPPPANTTGATGKAAPAAKAASASPPAASKKQ